MSEEYEIILLEGVVNRSFDLRPDGRSPGRLYVGNSNYPYEPYPWLSFSPRELVYKPKQFLRFLEALGHWNGRRDKVGRGEWGLFPITVIYHQEPHCVIWGLQPREINEGRSPEVLARLRRGTQELAEYLEEWAKAHFRG